MSFSAATVWEVRNGGSDANGGGFAAGASRVDYTQQDAAQVALTDMVINGTTNTIFSSTTLGSNEAYVGNIINVTGGTGFTVQRVQIVSRSGANYTCDKSLGTLSSTGGTGNLGGALASPGQACGLLVGGNTLYIKYNATPYTITSSSSNVAGGKLAPAGGTGTTVATLIAGYDSNRTTNNTDANRPTISAGSISTITIAGAATYQRWTNLIIDGNSQSSTIGWVGASYVMAINCKAINCTSYGFRADSYTCSLRNCETTGCSGTASIDLGYSSGQGTAINCYAHDNTTTGFRGGAGAFFLWCISDSNSGGTSHGFSTSSVSAQFINCVAYNNGGDGFSHSYSGAYHTLWINCIAYANTGVGWYVTDARSINFLINCGGGSNSSNYNSSYLGNVENFQAFSASISPFVDAPNGNFALDPNTSAGAACIADGYPAIFPAGLTSAFPDIGAAQHQDAGGSGPVGRATIIQNIGTY